MSEVAWIVNTQFGRTLSEVVVVKTTDKTITVKDARLVWSSND